MAKKVTISKGSNLRQVQKQIQKDIKKDIGPKVIQKAYGKSYTIELRKSIKPFSKSGKLKRSFRTIFKRDIVEIRSNLPYAAIQDLGGRIRITEKMRKKMWALYYETKNSMYKAIALTKKKFITMPKKDYSDVDWRKVYNRTMKRLRKNFK